MFEVIICSPIYLQHLKNCLYGSDHGIAFAFSESLISQCNISIVTSVAACTGLH